MPRHSRETQRGGLRGESCVGAGFQGLGSASRRPRPTARAGGWGETEGAGQAGGASGRPSMNQGPPRALQTETERGEDDVKGVIKAEAKT